MNIQEILSRHHVRCWEEGEHRNVRHGWIGTSCPFCGSGSSKAHLGINLEGTYAVCWQCGYHRIGDVLMRLTGKSWREVGEWLEPRLNRPESPRNRLERESRYTTPPGLQALRGPYERYLVDRGFNPDDVSLKWGILSTGGIGPLSWRLFIPIYLDLKPVSWTTRAIGDKLPKYRSAGSGEELIPHKRLLYGMDHVRGSAIVVEGPLDAWAVGPGAVATFGLGCTQEQFDVIAQIPRRVICYDSEPIAQVKARQLAERLKRLPGETFVVELESGADPAEADEREIESIRRKFLGD